MSVPPDMPPPARAGPGRPPLSVPRNKDEPPLPHPAEDLSADDDLLSWILVDQLGCMPNSRLGVHPQENKFVGPVFKTDDVLAIMKETAVKGNMQAAMTQLQEFHLIKSHLEKKRTESQRDRFIQHLRRYLLCYIPTSRIDIHSTDRYTHITKHPELAVYATRPLPAGAVLQELQGSVVPLPDVWREEMDVGDEFAREAVGQESASESDEEEAPRRKSKEVERGQRRSDRTRRRDFSIVWSGLKRCYQLFLGPARFLNHDCAPNVELLRQGKYVTFRVVRPIRIGDEITTYYGEDYFGKDNAECLCLTCEQTQRGRFAPLPPRSRSRSDTRSATPATPRKPKTTKLSGLRNVYQEGEASGAAEELEPVLGDVDDETGDPEAPSETPGGPPEELDELDSGSDDSDSDSEPIVREKLSRTAKTNAKPWSFLKRPKPAPSVAESSVVDEDLPEDFPRCGSCAKALHERMWYAGRYFDHCARCTRHAFIFGLPWPAHRQADVQEYPPAHLVPNGYIPRRISTIPLPSLQKKKFKEVPVEVPPADPLPVSREYRLQVRFRKEIEMDEFIIESLRETAWVLQVSREEAIVAAAEAAAAKIEAKKLAREEKKRRDASRIKGSGLWSRYDYITEDEFQRREAAKNAVTSGTRRGRQFKRVEPGSGDEAEQQDASMEVVRAPPQPVAESSTSAEKPPAEPTLESSPKSARMPKKIRTALHAASLTRPALASGSAPALPPAKMRARPSKPKLPKALVLTPDPIHKRRGRPPGTGKHQIAAAKAEAERRVSLATSEAATSATNVNANASPSSASPDSASAALSRSTATVDQVETALADDEVLATIEVKLPKVQAIPMGKLTSKLQSPIDKKKPRTFFPSVWQKEAK